MFIGAVRFVATLRCVESVAGLPCASRFHNYASAFPCPAHTLYPPLPFLQYPCVVSGGAGGEGTVTFPFPNFLGRLDIEVLLCVCCLDEVLLLVHCCVLQISCMEGTALYPVSCRTLSFSQFQPRMSTILMCGLLVLLSICNVQTGDPIPVARVEHVQLFKRSCPRRGGPSGTGKVAGKASSARPGMHTK